MSDRINQLRTQLQTSVHQAKSLYAEIERKGDSATADEKTNLNNMIDQGMALRAEIEKIEKLDGLHAYSNAPASGAKAVSAGADRRSWGQQVIDSQQFKSNDRRKMNPVEVRSIYNQVDAQGGAMVRPDREIEVIDRAPLRPITVLNLFNQSTTSSDAVEYTVVTSKTNGAAPTPEWDSGNFGLRPASDMGFDLLTAAVVTIPTYVAASRQILSDAPRLQQMIDGELRDFVRLSLENQTINGNGTAPNFTGILNMAGRLQRQHRTGARSQATDSTADTIRRALTDVALQFYPTDGIAMNPADAEEMELIKTSQGAYVNIFDAATNRVWRTPVVETSVLAQGRAIVGAWRLAATLWDRQQTEIRIGEPNDYFIRGAVAIMAELRAAFAVTRPLALCDTNLVAPA